MRKLLLALAFVLLAAPASAQFVGTTYAEVKAAEIEIAAQLARITERAKAARAAFAKCSSDITAMFNAYSGVDTVANGLPASNAHDAVKDSIAKLIANATAVRNACDASHDAVNP